MGPGSGEAGCVQRGFVENEEIHAAKVGVIFQRTIHCRQQQELELRPQTNNKRAHHVEIEKGSEGEDTSTSRSPRPSRRQQRRRLQDGIICSVEGDIDRGSARVDEAEVGGGNVACEEEEGFYRLSLLSSLLL